MTIASNLSILEDSDTPTFVVAENWTAIIIYYHKNASTCHYKHRPVYAPTESTIWRFPVYANDHRTEKETVLRSTSYYVT